MPLLCSIIESEIHISACILRQNISKVYYNFILVPSESKTSTKPRNPIDKQEDE